MVEGNSSHRSAGGSWRRCAALIYLIAMVATGCDSADSSDVSDEFGADELVAALGANGVEARIEASPYALSPFLSNASSEQVLCIAGQESIVHEYGSAEMRRAESAAILPDGGFAMGHFDLRRGRVMWWAKGRVIVNYNEADPQLWDSLSAVLGEPLSPDSETTGDLSEPPESSDICG